MADVKECIVEITTLATRKIKFTIPTSVPSDELEKAILLIKDSCEESLKNGFTSYSDIEYNLKNLVYQKDRRLVYGTLQNFVYYPLAKLETKTLPMCSLSLNFKISEVSESGGVVTNTKPVWNSSDNKLEFDVKGYQQEVKIKKLKSFSKLVAEKIKI